MGPITRQLADFALDTRPGDLPEAVRAESVRAFLNWAGCAVGGSNTATADAAVRGMLAMGRSGQTHALGRAEPLDFADAGVVDCVSSSAHTFDDTHLKTITHPTGPVAASLLAVARTRIVRGEDLLAALAIGMEVECRIALAIAAPKSGAHQGWYMTGLAGGIGAAAGLAHLLKLDYAQAVSAIGLAATQAGGLRSSHGSMALAYVPGVTVQQALYSAYLAREGFTCGDIAIDGRNGLFAVVAPGADSAAIGDDLGRDYAFLENTYKPYPCGIVIHPAIDACLEIAAMPGFRAQDIERVDLEVHPDALNLCWRKLPATALDAQVSLYHWVAAALIHGAAGLEQGTTECVQDPRVRALQERIVPVVSITRKSDQAMAVVHMSDGKHYRALVEHAVGSIARPMSNEELEAKFRVLVRRVLSEEATHALLLACWHMPSMQDAAQVVRLATPK